MRTTFEFNIPQYRAVVDRDKAYALGVPVKDIFTAMQSTFGMGYINDFTLFGRNFQVNQAADTPYRVSPDDLRQVYVRSANDGLIPISSLVTLHQKRKPWVKKSVGAKNHRPPKPREHPPTNPHDPIKV